MISDGVKKSLARNTMVLGCAALLILLILYFVTQNVLWLGWYVIFSPFMQIATMVYVYGKTQE